MQRLAALDISSLLGQRQAGDVFTPTVWSGGQMRKQTVTLAAPELRPGPTGERPGAPPLQACPTTR